MPGPDPFGSGTGVLGLVAVYPGNNVAATPVRERDIVNPSSMIEIGDFDPTGSKVEINSTNANAFPAGIQPGGVLAVDSVLVDMRHNGGANIGFCDGHVEYGKALQWTNNLSPRWNRDNQSHPPGPL